MAHKKAGGTTQTGRDSIAKRRGVKRFGGHKVSAGEVLIRQKGYRYRPGRNTYCGKDWTIHAGVSGAVQFSKKKMATFCGSRKWYTVIHVMPASKEA